MFHNLITQRLDGSPEYHTFRDIAAFRFSHEDVNVVITYFSTNHGLISLVGLLELSALLEMVSVDSNISGVIITDNNEQRPNKRHVSFPGVDIEHEFVAPFEAIARGEERPMRTLLDTGQATVELIAQYSKPIIGAVIGDIYGGGVELLAFTVSVFAEQMRLALPECGLNVPEFLEDRFRIIPDIGDRTLHHPCCLFPGWHGQRSLLFHMLDLKRCSVDAAISANDDFVFRGKDGMIDATAALNLGIVDKVCKTESLFDTAIGCVCSRIHMVPRKLGQWTAPERPPNAGTDANDRDTLGAVACDESLYQNSGSWRDVGNRDAALMIDAMTRAMHQEKSRT